LYDGESKRNPGRINYYNMIAGAYDYQGAFERRDNKGFSMVSRK